MNLFSVPRYRCHLGLLAVTWPALASARFLFGAGASARAPRGNIRLEMPGRDRRLVFI
jgi:hypothetical protein